MNNQEAKFILAAYRPDGRDAADPIFAEPLAHAERDPELRQWLERQRQFDAELSNKLRAIPPPPGLREAILAGVRISQPRRRWWIHSGWLAAAAIVVAGILSFSLWRAAMLPGAADLSALAVRDLAEAHDNHEGYPAGLSGVQAQLADARVPLTNELGIDRDELRRKACRSVTLAGREVFEICFRREGTWYHLYIARRKDFAPGAIDPKALVASHGEFASTAWADSKNLYVLVAEGIEAVRRVI